MAVRTDIFSWHSPLRNGTVETVSHVFAVSIRALILVVGAVSGIVFASISSASAEGAPSCFPAAQNVWRLREGVSRIRAGEMIEAGAPFTSEGNAPEGQDPDDEWAYQEDEDPGQDRDDAYGNLEEKPVVGEAGDEASAPDSHEESGDWETETDEEESEGPKLSDEEEQGITAALVSRSIARLAYQAQRMIARRELDEALSVIDYGLAIDSSYLPFWRSRALIHIEQGNHDDAQAALGVCLLANPDDADARALSLVNAIREKDLDDRARMLRLIDGIQGMDRNLFSRIVAIFAGRQDFHEELPAFLQAWRRSDGGLDEVRTALNLYAGGNAEQADVVARAISPSSVPSGVLMPVRGIIHTALDPDDIGGWRIEQGELTRHGDAYMLTSRPERQAFAWLRLSPRWRDVAVTISFPTGVDAQNSLYLRYTSPESYLRLTTRDGMLLVQERIAGLGLSTIFRCPVASFAPHPLHLVLRGNRLSLSGGGRSLIDPPLPVSDAIDSGRVALASDNSANDRMNSAVFSELRITRLSPQWRILSPDMSQDVSEAMLLDDSLTGITVKSDIFSSSNRRALSSILLEASGRGLMTIGELPDGVFDADALSRAVDHLPKILSERIWSAVGIRPLATTNWTEVSAALSAIRRDGRQSVLILDRDSAESLAGFKGELWADWLRLDIRSPLPDSVDAALAKRYARSVRLDTDVPSRFIP